MYTEFVVTAELSEIGSAIREETLQDVKRNLIEANASVKTIHVVL